MAVIVASGAEINKALAKLVIAMLTRKTSAKPLLRVMTATKLEGPTRRPTPMSDTARPNNSTFEGECRDGVLHIETSTRALAMLANVELRMTLTFMRTRTLVGKVTSNMSRVMEQQQWNCYPVCDECLLPESMVAVNSNLITQTSRFNWNLKCSSFSIEYLTLSLARVINFKFPLQPHQK